MSEKEKKEIKYAVVFAGQGAQKPGMGKSLYETSKAARAVFDMAGDEIKYNCFEADAEILKQTEVTQPAVYTVDMAAFAALIEALSVNEDGFPQPSAVAGFSLGEYAAFTAAGVIDSLETGLELVKKRSLLMKKAGTNPDGSQRGTMAAGLGSREAVVALVEKARGNDVLEAVNFNSPNQTVVAGDVSAVERFALIAKEDKSHGVRVIPLPVSGAFHSPIMLPAAEGFAEALQGYSFGKPKYTVYLNVTGQMLDDFEATEKSRKEKGINPDIDTDSTDSAVKNVMVKQIKSPVEWQKIIESIEEAGIEIIIEVGPGKTLSGLAKKIAPGLKVFNVEDSESLGETVSLLKEVQ